MLISNYKMYEKNIQYYGSYGYCNHNVFVWFG